MQLLALVLATAVVTAAAEDAPAVDLLTVTAAHGEVFRLQLNSSLLANSSDIRPSDELHFSASLRDGPDLPNWLAYAAGARRRTGLIYGVPPHHVQQFKLEVIVTNERTYQTSRRELLIVMEEGAAPASHEVQMKINNMNPVDLFSNSRLERLLEIYEQILWPASAGRLHLSWLESASAVAPAPPLPHQPAGALLRLASSAPFSDQLRHLQREVRSLWARVPCPRDFKRASIERHFRQRGFHMDWCQFKLYESGELSLPADQSTTPAPPPTAGRPAARDALLLPSVADVPVRSYTLDFLVTICLPLLVALLLCGALTCIMCCQGEHLRRPTDEVQMVQYARGSETGTLRSHSGTLRSQTGTLRRGLLRDVSPRLAEQTERNASARHAPSAGHYRDLSPTLSGPSTPESGGFVQPSPHHQQQLQPPPYHSPGRRS